MTIILKNFLVHIFKILMSAAVISTMTGGLESSAQKIRMPARWMEEITEVKPLFTPDTLTICVLGDIMMHQAQIDHARDNDGSYDFSSYFRLIQGRIKKADLAIANLEFTLAGKPYAGYPQFSAPEEIAQYLSDCGIDIFLTANNHILDRGSAGAKRTVEIYREMEKSEEILMTGTAEDERAMERCHPLKLTRKGIRLSVINCTYGTNIGGDKHWPKTFRISDMESLERALTKADESDYTFVFPHWGSEYRLSHSDTQEKTGKWMAEKGADVIIGAHPHVIQDFEEIVTKDGRRVPVAYSLGNAVSNMSAINTQMGLIATIRIERDIFGRSKLLPVEFTYIWCSRPGGFDDCYTVIPVAEFIDRPEEWNNIYDYEKMSSTYFRVSNETGIKDNEIDD